MPPSCTCSVSITPNSRIDSRAATFALRMFTAKSSPSCSRKHRRCMASEQRRISRRRFLGAALVTGTAARALAQETITLPFENGERPLVKYPQKRPLLRLTARPPQLETPFSVFNESVLTPNDAFFVRYHLTLSPPPAEALTPEKFRLQIIGKIQNPLTLSVDDLQKQFEP